MKTLSLLSFLILLTSWSCSTSNSEHRDPRLTPQIADANELLGLTKSEVVAKLGPPSDERSGRTFWFLVEKHLENYPHVVFDINNQKGLTKPESGDYKSTSKLYEFVFKDERLVNIKPVNQ